MDFLGSNQPTPERPGAYVRISSDPFGEERGIDRQIADTQAKAKQLGWGAPQTYAENDTSAFRRRKVELPDGTTAMRVVRPQFRQALDDLKDGTIDGLLVYDIDRLVRDPRDLEDLVDVCVEHQRPVQAVTTNLDLLSPDGQVMARMLVNFAHKSSQDTSRRVSRALAEKARRGGQLTSTRPFGWEEDRKTLRPKEAAILREVIKHITEGGTITDGIRMLEASGVPPVRSKTWQRSSLRLILCRPALAGIATYRGKARGEVNYTDWKRSALRDENGDYITGDWEPLISIEEWEQVNTILDARKPVWIAREKSLLTGVIRCGLCGVKLTTGTNGGARTYRCSHGSGGCGKIARQLEPIDDYITAVISARLATIGEVSVEKETNEPSAETQEAQSRINKLRDAYAEGTITDETFFSMIPKLEERIAQLRKGNKRVVKTKRSASEMQATWDDPEATTMWRRNVLEQLLIAIEVLPAKPGRRIFNPEKEIKVVWR